MRSIKKFLSAVGFLILTLAVVSFFRKISAK